MRLFRLVWCLAVAGVFAGAGGVAHADACPPAAVLDGETVLVTAIRLDLAARGIAVDAVGACVLVRARIERAAGDDTVTVTIAVGDGTEVVRTVHGLHTAATVIESFTRTDVGFPLLATRAISPPPPPPPRSPSLPLDVAAAPPVASHAPRASYHLFVGPELTKASDDSRWIGFQFGGCVVLGPVCAGARGRHGRLLHRPGTWMEGTERTTQELLIGLDVPLRAGRVLVIPGFSAGFGGFQTRNNMTDLNVETGGLRADAHASVVIPLWGKLALDLSVAVDLAQQTEPFEGIADLGQIPPEPLVLSRFGVGLRYGER